MACHVFPGPITPDCEGVQEAVCIHTRKVMDSCRDKDCLEDLQFFPSTASTDVLSTAVALKGGCSELLYVLVNVQPVCFKRGYYTIDMRYYYRVTLQAYQSTSVRGTEVEGLCVFDKRCMLFGSEGGSKVFTSLSTCLSGDSYAGDALPIAVVEAVFYAQPPKLHETKRNPSINHESRCTSACFFVSQKKYQHINTKCDFDYLVKSYRT